MRVDDLEDGHAVLWDVAVLDDDLVSGLEEPLPRMPGRYRFTPVLPPEYRRRPRAAPSLPEALRWGDRVEVVSIALKEATTPRARVLRGKSYVSLFAVPK